MVQIETRVGVEKRDEILSVPGIDGCLVGTGDLAFSLGCPGRTNHPDVLAAVEKVFATCREKNLIHTLPIRTPDDTARWQASGMNMLTLSTDGGLLTAGAAQFLSSVNRQPK
jgi:4-hydroxy-2-oxoheptanedioate aldolase